MSEEAFLEELEGSINLFLRGELLYSQYLRGERFLPNDQDGQQLLRESVYVEQQAYDTLTSADDEQLLSDKPRNGRSEPNKPRNRSSNSPMDQRFADNPPNLSEWMIAFVPKNTRKNTKWALTNFNAWRQHYNRVHVNVCVLIWKAFKTSVNFAVG